jgi:hypothetical protein
VTVDEYRAALDSLSAEQFADFRARWRDARPTIDECVTEFDCTDEPDVWDWHATFHLRGLGLHVRTEREKRAHAAAPAVPSRIEAAAATSVPTAWIWVAVSLTALALTLALASR